METEEIETPYIPPPHPIKIEKNSQLCQTESGKRDYVITDYLTQRSLFQLTQLLLQSVSIDGKGDAFRDHYLLLSNASGVGEKKEMFMIDEIMKEQL
jgi:hypothetical protein